MGEGGIRLKEIEFSNNEVYAVFCIFICTVLLFCLVSIILYNSIHPLKYKKKPLTFIPLFHLFFPPSSHFVYITIHKLNDIQKKKKNWNKFNSVYPSTRAPNTPHTMQDKNTHTILFAMKKKNSVQQPSTSFFSFNHRLWYTRIKK